MVLIAHLFSPAARVYTLRCVLLVNTAGVVLFASWGGVLPWLASFRVIYIHHILALFRWKIHGLATIDLALVFIEMAGGIFSLVSVVDLLFAPFLLPLLLCAVFRPATIIRSKERVFSQRFAFLGECRPTHPPYTPLTIILNRSLARPLVRGEFRYIIIARSLILSCVAVGVPAFRIYTVFVMPLSGQTYYRLRLDLSSDGTYWSPTVMPPVLRNVTVTINTTSNESFHDTAMPSVWNLTLDFSIYNPSFRDSFRDFIRWPLIALEAIVQNHPISVVLIVGFFGGDISNLEWSWASSRTLIHPATPISRFPVDRKHVFC
ncbi:hypothetical protein DFH09DRAFT_1284030, partial [Mycena vulgaris]